MEEDTRHLSNNERWILFFRLENSKGNQTVEIGSFNLRKPAKRKSRGIYNMNQLRWWKIKTKNQYNMKKPWGLGKFDGSTQVGLKEEKYGEKKR